MRIITGIALLSFVFLKYGNAQILNIEQKRINDSVPFIAEIKGSLLFLSNNTNLINANLKTNIQKNKGKNTYISIGELDYIRTGGQQILSNAYFHLRYNRKINKAFTIESFIQPQTNQQRNIDFRFLLGSGFRTKIHYSKIVSLNVGHLYMFEHINGPGLNYNIIRMSNYISGEINISKTTKIINTTYYQPRIDEFRDYKISTQTNLKIAISKKLSYVLTFNYAFDSLSPDGIVKAWYSILNEIMISISSDDKKTKTIVK